MQAELVSRRLNFHGFDCVVQLASAFDSSGVSALVCGPASRTIRERQRLGVCWCIHSRYGRASTEAFSEFISQGNGASLANTPNARSRQCCACARASFLSSSICRGNPISSHMATSSGELVSGVSQNREPTEVLRPPIVAWFSSLVSVAGVGVGFMILWGSSALWCWRNEN
jgi:hypothetical protein